MAQFKPRKLESFVVLCALMSFPLFSALAEQKLDPTTIAANANTAQFYNGQDLVAHVSMEIVRTDGATRKREVSMLRRNASGKDQQLFMYFQSPPDVKQMAYLVHKYPSRDDDRWLYVPALNAVRRIAAKDKRTSFAGSDFTYEDTVGRDVSDEKHTLRGEETVAGRACYVLVSTPVEAGGYARRVSWVDKERWLPLKEEYYDSRNELTRVYTSDEISQVEGVWMIVKMSMRNAKSGQRTQVTMHDIDLKVGLDDATFSEGSLRTPPRQWLR